MTTKGFARYELIAAAAMEDTIAESAGSSISVDITWNGVEKILETPPLISAATLVSQDGKNKSTQALGTIHIVSSVKDKKQNQNLFIS